ncbi:hypothetical protein E5676_scaffold376G00080 [Cucumis melo var. makuwa]|uniref:Uncharacterized protein n=1 Tax=Cucumis melo var. makuwa TaxID=1194695 RepID=A0A5A7TGI5_CUCMM|nr:hypothetical protein E6C27_scaffold44G00060 [Cucumis melo var. makuwa]TYK05917.1 hypothetical protein E5676_scaffold376G00080 [Cucumis melo var. makuwa]
MGYSRLPKSVVKSKDSPNAKGSIFFIHLLSICDLRLSFALIFSLLITLFSALLGARIPMHCNNLAVNRNTDDLILNLGSAAASIAAAAHPLSIASSAGNAAVAAPAPVEKKVEVMEEIEDDMVFACLIRDL